MPGGLDAAFVDDEVRGVQQDLDLSAGQLDWHRVSERCNLDRMRAVREA
jgi:hypothetical protein